MFEDTWTQCVCSYVKSICFGDHPRRGTSYGYDELDLDDYSNLTTDKLDYYWAVYVDVDQEELGKGG